MGSQAPNFVKPSKPPNQSPGAPLPRISSSLLPHVAMVELKRRILTSISKLSDRDTHGIAVEDLENIIQSVPPDGFPMLLKCLIEASADPKTAVKKESIRLLAVCCTSYGETSSTHITKIICHIVKRLKDTDSGIRDSCRDAFGALSAQFLKDEVYNGDLGALVSLFTKPLFEAMIDQSKGVQAGAAMCMAKMVESAPAPPIAAFQKLCPRICKFVNNPNFQAKASLLSVVGALSQVGAIAPQSLEALLHCIHNCLSSPDWATRKGAADALSALALNSNILLKDNVASTVRVLEACRFDKIKPARDGMLEALQLWKEIAGKVDGSPVEPKASSNEREISEQAVFSGMSCQQNLNLDESRGLPSVEESSNRPSFTCDSVAQGKSDSISGKAAGILKKKPPALSDNELNADFFQKLHSRSSGELPVEVIVPHNHFTSPSMHNDEETGTDDTTSVSMSNHSRNCQPDGGHNMECGATIVFPKQQNFDGSVTNQWDGKKDKKRLEADIFDDVDGNPRDSSKTEVQFDESFNRGNWLTIQRQLLQLERQQTHLMNLLQDFMGGSHDTMENLECRVRGLERVVEDMAQDLSISSGRKGRNFVVGFEASSDRSRYNGFSDYPFVKLGRGGDGRAPFGERSLPSDSLASGIRGRVPFNSQIGARRVLDGDGDASKRVWEKGAGPGRLGEGPSARSVWRASKDEATLEAIRVAGEDNGKVPNARMAVPELSREVEGDGRDLLWTCWSGAIDALQEGDMDSAYAEVLSSEDDSLLWRLMDRSGPVLNELTNEIAIEVLLAVGQFLLEPNLFGICQPWMQQLLDLVMESGLNVLGIPGEIKRELLWNLRECSLAVEVPEDWEGASADQLMTQLASAWRINLQQLGK